MRRISILAAALAAAVAVVPLAGARPAGETPVYPTIYVNYTMNCTFSLSIDGGGSVATIPPGTYQVDVITPIQFRMVNPELLPAGSLLGCDGNVQFQLTGPNVSLFTTLVTGCESNLTLPPTYFAPSSTFTAVDLNDPSITQTSFSTAASGSPPVVEQTTPTGKAASQSDLVGSAATSTTSLAGSLVAAVSAHGAASLSEKGKAVSQLTAGRYRVTVEDHSATSGFVLQERSHAATTLASAGFTGTRTLTLKLAAGQWSFSAGGKGAKTYFVVSG